jgi:P27 family predicted phage terminase small subunit
VAGARGRSGGRRRGAGRPRLGDQLHRLRGTWRPDRHGRVGGGALPAITPVAIEPSQAPAHLEPATQAWYRHVCETWVLEPHHLRLLQAAAEAWDIAQAARASVARDGLTIATADGSVKAHPCLTVATAARAQFASLLAQLELDEAGRPGGER